MKIKDMKQEDLELLSYTDLTELILKESKKGMTTPQIFKEICSILGLTDEEYAAKIGDYYTSLTTDKRFIFLDNEAEWDLRDRHVIKIIVADDDEEDALEETEEEEEEIIEEVEEEDIDSVIDDDLDDDDDDMEELSIVSDDELEEEA